MESLKFTESLLKSSVQNTGLHGKSDFKSFLSPTVNSYDFTIPESVRADISQHKVDVIRDHVIDVPVHTRADVSDVGEAKIARLQT